MSWSVDAAIAIVAALLPHTPRTPELSLDLGLGGALEDGHVYVADRHHAPLVAERDEPVELVHLERRVGLLVEVDRDRDEAHVHEVLMDLVCRPADVDGRADLLRL